eukprot:4604272-Pleurochrysis_carterae.AAC.2
MPRDERNEVSARPPSAKSTSGRGRPKPRPNPPYPNGEKPKGEKPKPPKPKGEYTGGGATMMFVRLPPP